MLLNLTEHQQPDVVKDPFESKYQLPINGRKIVEIKELKYPEAFIDYLQTCDDVHGNLE